MADDRTEDRLTMLGRISKSRFVSLVLVLAFVTVSFTSVAHTHKIDTKAPEHCGLCQAGHQIRTGNTPVLQKVALPPLREITLEQVHNVPVSFFSSSSNLSRAPPA